MLKLTESYNPHSGVMIKRAALPVQPNDGSEMLTLESCSLAQTQLIGGAISYLFARENLPRGNKHKVIKWAIAGDPKMAKTTLSNATFEELNDLDVINEFSLNQFIGRSRSLGRVLRIDSSDNGKKKPDIKPFIKRKLPSLVVVEHPDDLQNTLKGKVDDLYHAFTLCDGDEADNIRRISLAVSAPLVRTDGFQIFKTKTNHLICTN